MAGVKGKSGGVRPGAGRKPSLSKKVQVTITITAQQRADLDYLKGRAVDTNAVIGREIHHLAEMHRAAAEE